MDVNIELATSYRHHSHFLWIYNLNLLAGKTIPTELRKEEAELRKELEFDDQNTNSKYCQLYATTRYRYQTV